MANEPNADNVANADDVTRTTPARLRKLPIRDVTVLTPQGQSWHLEVACPEKGHTVSAETCASCQRLRELLPPDEEGRSWIVCAPRPFHDAPAALTVGDLMTPDVFCARMGVPAKQVIALMRQRDFQSVPIVDEAGVVTGLVTRADVTRLANDGTAIERLMQPPLTLRESMPVPAAAHAMAEARVHDAPVVSDDGHVVGVLSSLDVLRWLGSQGEAR